MILQGIAVIVALVGVSSSRGEEKPATGRSITICAQPAADLSFGMTEQQARPIVSKIFANIGVAIKWCDDLLFCPADGIRISFSSETPRNILPRALAYALPSEGAHIVVFSDRVKAAVQPDRTPSLLAHVLAHEITHMLQGIVRHSVIGIMKAYWDESDYCQMAWKPLSFIDLDVQLIHRGTQERGVWTA